MKRFAGDITKPTVTCNYNQNNGGVQLSTQGNFVKIPLAPHDFVWIFYLI